MTEEQFRQILADFVAGYVNAQDTMRRKFVAHLIRIICFWLLMFTLIALILRWLTGDVFAAVMLSAFVATFVVAIANS